MSPPPGLPSVRASEEMALLARRYCQLIDHSGDPRESWLKDVARLLPRLHAAIASTGSQRARRVVVAPPVDLDARFDLFARLFELLADRDAYWLEFDLCPDAWGGMSGSLADDLTDIYCELKTGLAVFDLDPESAMAAWTTGFAEHWGQHLADAERHLALLWSQERLDA